MSETNTMDKIAAKLPALKNSVIHGLKDANEIFSPEWGFTRDEANITAWSSTPAPFRCRMYKNKSGDRVAFELELKPDRTDVVKELLQVILFPIHIDQKLGYSVGGLSFDTHHRYNKEQMLERVLIPVVVDLVSTQNSNVECQSVTVSVTMPREDGAYDIDVSRFVWYFGKAAKEGPRLSHMPLYLQQQMRDERKNLRGRGLPSDYSSTIDSRSSRSSSLGKRVLKLTKKALGAPPGAGIPRHYVPQPYLEEDGLEPAEEYYTTRYNPGSKRPPSTTDSYADPSGLYTPRGEDTKASSITADSSLV